VDWFYGFNLHLVINDRSELLSLRLTPGNTDAAMPPIVFCLPFRSLEDVQAALRRGRSGQGS
jgi:hypothetical protein